MSQGEEKTEAPTPSRIREARKKGQVPKSSDVVALLGFFVTILLLFFYLPHCFVRFKEFFLLTQLFHEQDSLMKFSATLSKKGLDLWFIISFPILLAAFLGALLGNIGQFGFLFSTHNLKIDVKKINPVNGFKKLFSKDRAVELLKQLLKFSAVFWVIFVSLRSFLSQISLLFRANFLFGLQKISEIISVVIIRVLICFLFIAAIDFFWQRYSFFKNLRMSKYEVKKEFKQQEGDPLLKQERKRIHQEVLNSESERNVENASVLITNPSHLAIGLRYEGNEDEVPRVIAKGAGDLAKKLKEIARKNNIPIMRNVPLAHSLSWLEIDEEIPEIHFEAVAEILNFIDEVNQQSEA